MAGVLLPDGSELTSSFVGTALADWVSQPTQTAAAAADTILKYGVNGDQSFRHYQIQNNSSVNFIYKLDSDSTVAGAKVYTVAPGIRVWEDRTGTTIHCHSASQVSFGGDAGITIETYQ